MILMYFIPLIVILAMNGATVSLADKKFGDSIPLTMLGAGFVVYLSQFIFHTYQVGVVMLWIWALTGLVLVVMKKKWDKFFSAGFFAFMLCAIFVIMWDFNRSLSDFDEYWHWGMMIKESLRLDSFHCVDASNMVIHKDYPPFLPMIELVWCKLAGGYSAGVATAGLHTFCLSLLVPGLMDTVENRGKGLLRSVMLLCAILLLIVAMDYARVFNTLLADIPLGVVFGYCLFMVFSERIYKSRLAAISFALASASLLLIKQAGMAHFMIVMFACVLFSFWNFKEKKVGGKYVGILLGGSAVPAVIGNVIWKVTLAGCNIADIRAAEGGNGQFNLSKIQLGDYIHAITHSEDWLRYSTFWDLIKSVFNRNVGAISYFPMSYLMICFLLVLLVILFLGKNKQLFSKERQWSVIAVFTLGNMAYIFMLSLLFLFCFTTDEMMELRGYERYVDSLLLGELLSVFMLSLVYYFKQERHVENSKLAVWVLSMLIFLGGTNLFCLAPQLARGNGDGKYQVVADYINECIPEGATVTLIYDSSNNFCDVPWYGGVQSYLQYFVNDKKLLWGMDIYRADLSNQEILAKAMEQINDSDYIFVLSTNDTVNSYLGSRSKEGTLANNTIYKVSQGDVSFVPVLGHGDVSSGPESGPEETSPWRPG